MKHLFSQYTISQSGFTQWLILIVLMLGIGVGVWVAQVRTNLVPQAAVQTPVQTNSITLKLNEVVEINKPFNLEVEVRSDSDPVRLVTAHLKYDPNVIELIKVNIPRPATESGVIYATASAQPIKEPIISQWLETLFDNKSGSAAITGLLDNGDLKTEQNKDPFSFVTITLKAKKLTPTEITIEESSLLLRAADNANILTKTENIKIEPRQATPSATN